MLEHLPRLKKFAWTRPEQVSANAFGSWTGFVELKELTLDHGVFEPYESVSIDFEGFLSFLRTSLPPKLKRFDLHDISWCAVTCQFQFTEALVHLRACPDTSTL
jgi:hypothetical protein